MSQLHPIDLHCEYRQNPLGIDVTLPRFGWALEGGGNGAVQSAYRITVSAGNAICWDSGKVAGDAQMHVVYAGAALADRTRYSWRVQVWDGQGAEGLLSAPAFFETAFLDPARFAGEWIGIKPQGLDERHPLAVARWLRPNGASELPMAACGVRFSLPGQATVRRAVLHCLAEGHDQPWSCGVYQYLSVNGTRPDSCANLPRLAVMTYDIARWLKPGENHVAMRWFVQGERGLHRTYRDRADRRRARISIPTGTSAWRARPCPQRHPDPEWDDPAAGAWAAGQDVGAFGAGPWPAEDRRNRSDRLIPALALQRVFRLQKPLARARIYATAAGVYELTLGGHVVADRVLAPGWTDYRKRIHYQTYDVTHLLAPGDNTLAASVGDGWWSGHLATPFGCSFYGFEKSLKLALHLDYADGSVEVIATEPALWKGRAGSSRLADLMEGQTIDLARTLAPWRAVQALAGPGCRLQAQPDDPVRRLLELPVRSLTEKHPGVYVVDFGQNLVGWLRLRIRAPRGTCITVRHTEVLDLQGEVWTENLRSALAVDRFICSGEDDVFEPSLTFHGFRYAELSGLPGGLRPEQLVAVVVGSDTPDRGTFSCDNPLLNRLQANIRWGQRGNFLSIPTDCPQRDERLGWTADTQVFARTAIYNADCAGFYGKYIDDLLDAEHPRADSRTTPPPTTAAMSAPSAGPMPAWSCPGRCGAPTAISDQPPSPIPPCGATSTPATGAPSGISTPPGASATGSARRRRPPTRCWGRSTMAGCTAWPARSRAAWAARRSRPITAAASPASAPPGGRRTWPATAASTPATPRRPTPARCAPGCLMPQNAPPISYARWSGISGT